METYLVKFKEGETTGVYGISLVNDPAIESLFVALSKEEQIQLKAVNEEQRIVCGAVLIPDKPIYRNQGGREFNIVFPAETIKLASENFFKQGYQSSSTLEHNVDAQLSGVTIVESWIKLSDTNDKSVMYGFNEPIGTWYASMKIDNNEIWNDFVKTGKVKGFSIDGFFDMEKVNMSKNVQLGRNLTSDEQIEIFFDNTMLVRGDEVRDNKGELLQNATYQLMTNVEIDVVDGIVKDIREVNLKSEYMITEIVDAIKSGFGSLSKDKEVLKLGSVKTADGSVEFMFDGDTIAIGTSLTMPAPDGTTLPVPDGDYKLEDGTSLSILNSVVAEIATAQEEEETDEPMNPQTPMSDNTAPLVKSEKVTQEVFYQLSKEDMNTLVLEFGKQLDVKISELRAEFETKLNSQNEIVELTKAKPIRKNEPQTAFEKFRNRTFNK